MEAKAIDGLLINIRDEIKITIPNFYYKIEEKFGHPGLTEGYDKPGEDGWIHCPNLEGTFCGSRHDSNSGELKVVKIRVHHPFEMGDIYYNYLEFHPSRITSIEVRKMGKGNIFDRISHTLTIQKDIPKN